MKEFFYWLKEKSFNPTTYHLPIAEDILYIYRTFETKIWHLKEPPSHPLSLIYPAPIPSPSNPSLSNPPSRLLACKTALNSVPQQRSEDTTTDKEP